MDNTENLFNPSLEAALMKLDPEDGEQIMEYLKTHALLSREKALLQASVREQKKLLVENGKLKKDIEQLRIQLQEKQKRRTAKALFSSAPPPPPVSPAPSAAVAPPASTAGATAAVPPSWTDRRGRRSRGSRKAQPRSAPLELAPRVDVSRLDLRVGQILSGRQHPLGTTMTVLEVDVGEKSPRTVVCRLGTATQLEELQGSLAVLLCNARPCKLKGVASQARLLCCSASEECVELLAPPSASTPGDRVTVLNYPGRPDAELPTKQRLWELLQPDLQVDCRGVATYKGGRLEVKGKGPCRAPSLTSCIIRQT